MHQVRPSLRSSVTEVEVGVVGTHRPEFGDAEVSAERHDRFSGESFDSKEPVARRRFIDDGDVRIRPRHAHLLTLRWRLPASLLHRPLAHRLARSEEHTSDLQSLMRISYAVFCF